MRTWQKPSFRSLLQETSIFVTCVELVNSRGVIAEREGTRMLKLARELSQNPQIHALCITSNAGGNAMLSGDTLGTDLISRGQEVVIHLSCKDWNRNGLQSQAWKLASEGFNNVLALSGDYPISGYQGQASAVFDIDSVGVLKMMSEMNAGLKISAGQKKKDRVLKQTSFFLGAVVNNHKQYEREVMPQYFKLKKKIENGASFIINQIGYDARKQDELLKYMDWSGLHVSVLANVYVLSLTAARFFHANNIPGVTVTDDLLALIEKQAGSSDKGKTFSLEFAAKQCAIAKGLGFRGVYLGGHLKSSDYERILEIADQFGEDDWKDFSKEICFHQTDEFYFFEPDTSTQLSSTEINREYLHSKSLKALQVSKQNIPLSYKINRVVHDKAFEKGTLGFGLGKKTSQAIERTNKGVQKILHGLEQTFKMAAFGCQDCGDCSLPDIAFLCPESQCAKNQRNGPCGGTYQGKCEVGEKECIWSLAYDRLKAYGQEEQMLNGPAIFKDGSLKGTSAWINTFLERDHHGGRVRDGIG
ncbi:TPA: methylenetetrahydrofolate reductase [Candidatus Poribacteria bacterium]|nr:methylenetetrahydrofolate reductase [Candidatus Poribacteria bacterium]